MTATIITRLSKWGAGLTLDQVPDPVIREAKRCLTDIAGVTIAGSRAEVAVQLRQSVAATYGRGPCTIWGTGDLKLVPSGAALANGVAAHALDYDDTFYEGIVHGSAAVWPAVVAAAESARRDGAGLLCAFIVGSESEYALGRILGNRMYDGGWWASGILGAIGAAAGASKALALDTAATQRAINLAACAAAGPRVVLGSQAKPVGMGLSAETGVRSALLAQQGIEAPVDAITHEWGILGLHNRGVYREQLAETIGRQYGFVEPGLALKRYPVCSAAQTAVEAVADLMSKHELSGEQIVRVRCDVTPFVKMCLVHDNPTSVAQAQFSMPFAVGCILTYGCLGIEQLDKIRLEDQRLQATMGKVEMAVSPALSGAEFARGDALEAATVTLYTVAGERFQHHIRAATGMPCNPMPDTQLDRKFINCTSPVIGPQRAPFAF